jgi:hypothetical protein
MLNAESKQTRSGARQLLEVHYCTLEGKNFPLSDFVVDPFWGLLHNITPLHTATGTLIDGTGDPVTNPPAIHVAPTFKERGD